MAFFCGFPSDLVILSVMPIAVDIAKPFVHSKVVEGDVRDDLLFDDTGIDASDVKCVAKGSELGIAIEADSNGGIEGITEVLDELW